MAMSERLTITPLGPYIGAQVSGLDVTRPLSDNQFEQLYHAVLRHQVVFLREQAITPQQQRALALRFGDLHIHPVYPHAEGVEEIIVLDTHNDNPPDNDNWHTEKEKHEEVIKDLHFIDLVKTRCYMCMKVRLT